MRTLLISLFLVGIASAQVPSLINYQGRLTNAEGEPLTGTKNFELKIFDAQTEGNLLYTENVGDIQLAEGGVYSFQFGGKGTSNTQTTETVGTGNGENLYQKVLSNTPVVEGSVSVSDGTYSWSQESGSSNEDDFSSSFSKNLSRITVNYFADAPNDSRQVEVTYRYQSEGIMGALSSGSEHWLQLSIDGETQATRERVLAVPFALYAGKLANDGEVKIKRYFEVKRGGLFYNTPPSYPLFNQNTSFDRDRRSAFIILPQNAKKIKRIKTAIPVGSNRDYRLDVTINEGKKFGNGGRDVFTKEIFTRAIGNQGGTITVDLAIDHEVNLEETCILNFSLFYSQIGRDNWDLLGCQFNKILEIHYTE